MASNGHAPQPPMQLPYQPVPTGFHLLQGDVNGQAAVVMQIQSPVGVLGFFLDAEAALKLGGDLQRLGAAAKAGLILPGGPNG